MKFLIVGGDVVLMETPAFGEGGGWEGSQGPTNTRDESVARQWHCSSSATAPQELGQVDSVEMGNMYEITVPLDLGW